MSADRLSANYTERRWVNDAVNDLEMTVTVSIPSGQGKTKTGTLEEMGWQPLQLRYANGVNPNTISFKVAFLDDSQTDSAGNRIPVNLINQQDAIDFFRPSDSIITNKNGFSYLDPNDVAGLTPQTEQQHDAFTKRSLQEIPDNKLPYVVIRMKTRSNSSGSGKFMGRFWLSNISSTATDGLVVTFSDARFLWMKRFIDGAFYYYNTSPDGLSLPKRVFSGYSECIFNKGNRGNRNTLYNTTVSKFYYAFYPDFFATEAILDNPSHVQAAKRYAPAKWTLFDMLSYLVVQEYGKSNRYMPKVRAAMLGDRTTGIQLWKSYGGLNTPEVNISGQSALTALDMIIREAGNYDWTLVPDANNATYPWKVKIFERTRWSREKKQPNEVEKSKVMPLRRLELPTRGVPIQQTLVNVSNAQLDENSSKQIGRVVVYGDPVEIESTFSNVDDGDYSCIKNGGASTDQRATMTWLGDLSGWQSVYTSTSGTDAEKKQAACAAYPYAYRVLGFKDRVTSPVNRVNGMAFLPAFNQPDLMRQIMMMPYRLPDPPAYATYPGDGQDKPEVLVWAKYASDSDWTLLDDEGRTDFETGLSVDPQQGIRFSRPMVEITGSSPSYVFTEIEVRVTAAIQISEKLRIEVYRKDFVGETLNIETVGKYSRKLRWNSMQEDGDSAALVNEDIVNDIKEMELFAQGELARYERFRAPGSWTVPWIDAIFNVGDFVYRVYTGSSFAGSSVPPDSRIIETPICGVVYNLNKSPYSTELKTENWSQ